MMKAMSSYKGIAMKKTAIALTLTALIIPLGQPSYGNDLNSLLSGEDIPLTMPFQALDSQWRKIAISGQFEMGDTLQAWTNIFNNNFSSNIYYTKGQTVTLSNETYIIAYRQPLSSSGITLESLFTTVLSGGVDCARLNPTLSKDTSLSLSLLNLRTIGSLNNIHAVNREEELIEAEQAYQQAKVTCESNQPAEPVNPTSP